LPFETALIYALIVVGVIFACLIIIYAMRKHGRKEERFPEEEKVKMETKALPFKIAKTIPRNEAARAKEELRLLDLEREILGSAIRRLYEAHAEGKITEEEREGIAQTYKSRMMTVKEGISKDESLVALHELETMQEDLMKLFSDRIDELGGKIDELRSKVDVEPIKEIAVPTIEETVEKRREKTVRKKKRKTKEKAQPSPRTEAEKRIEKIRTEVEKVLDKLGQMEIET